jgi:hypothetical protein
MCSVSALAGDSHSAQIRVTRFNRVLLPPASFGRVRTNAQSSGHIQSFERYGEGYADIPWTAGPGSFLTMCREAGATFSFMHVPNYIAKPTYL